ncbi:MAG: thrombospondin type 3 repeat-containing protein [Alphaproteobacteria bacterium]|nr:thrombospondin type 3 repeat-containing protein [Alphaproteobacteria bacterium]
MRPTALLVLLAACGEKDSTHVDSMDSEVDDDTGVEGDTDTDTDADSDTDSDADADSDSDTDLTDCGVELTAAQEGACTLATRGEAGLWLRGEVLTPDGVLGGGSVVLDADGTILCVACDCSDTLSTLDPSRVDCAEGVISPGLINPHDHIGYTEGWPIDVGETRYDHRHDWRGSLSTPQNSDANAGRSWGELRQVVGGTTSMVGSGWQGGMVRNLDDNNGLEGLPILEVVNETFPLGDSREDFEADCGWDYRWTETEVSRFEAYIPHVAEGIEAFAAEEFRCQSISVDGGEDVTESNVAQVHGIGLSTLDYYGMARDRAQLVWSPRSNISLYGQTAQVTTFHRFGGVIALGTDWTYSGSARMDRELACADLLNQSYYDGYFSDRDLWEMATINGAIATGTEQLLGSLEVGKVGDIAVYDARERWRWRAIIEPPPEGAALVLRAGEVLYGEADVVAELDSRCEVIDACGESRAVCAAREFGETFEEIEAEIPEAYPVFFCDGPPTDEPTCVPSRPGEYDGASSDEDYDGDGLPDETDLCPTVFDPLRPVDGDVQLDADEDGVGDACDDTPLPLDLDGDGVENDLDNCPLDANADQADSDADLRGDACDLCPLTPNADTVCPEVVPMVTIDDIRTLPVGEGERVQIVDVVVTGVHENGMTVQDPADADGLYAGIYVYLNGQPSVSVGDVVDVVGEVGDYYGEAQLQSPEITLVSAGAGSLTPADVTAAEANTEPYEAVLVRITDLNPDTVDYPYDCSADGSACADPELWQVEGADGTPLIVFDRVYEDADWADHVGEEPVTGVINYRWNRYRLMPRTAADFGN